MIKRILPLAFLFLVVYAGATQAHFHPPKDSLALVKEVQALEATVKLKEKALQEKQAELDAVNSEIARKTRRDSKWWVTLMPLFLWVVMMVVFFRALSGNGKLARLLATGEWKQKQAKVEKEFQLELLKAESNEKRDTIRKARDSNEDPQPSSSRYVLFMSGMTAILLAVSIAVYYFHYTLNGCPDQAKMPDMNKLVNALVALGIGVIPYAVNKVGEQMKKSEG